MKVVAYLPAHHRADCPAWDNWQCNCGAEPIPLVRLDEAQAKPAWSVTQAEQDAMNHDQWEAWKAATKAPKEEELLEAYANGRKDEAEQEAEDSKRWRMLPAFIEAHQIDYLALLRDIDGALDKPMVADCGEYGHAQGACGNASCSSKVKLGDAENLNPWRMGFNIGYSTGAADSRAVKDALRVACDHIEMDALRISHCKDAAIIDDAFAAPQSRDDTPHE